MHRSLKDLAIQRIAIDAALRAGWKAPGQYQKEKNKR